jgi:hypothetical protein
MRCCYLLLFITAGPITKLFAWDEGDSGGRVLRETTSRGLCRLVCPSQDGYDRAVRREQKRQGKSKSNFGHKNHY